ncbi:hypothetical protein SLG_31380 [Sphingobium sp. SYK-6]|uniref:c-type cytochrome domain-containing protein n=1 Tax=Sphingobium sp. (strain NBRC 103272 / SYK-6) TaxID=627192 RepID=UPI00022775A5|nr:c-type cytochrome domain-containing protein [Sphingobium sp. SYK-6]BAK67813.1 hypothetical protein SLG_31380 [Sphingobium sp. SYK-6]
MNDFIFFLGRFHVLVLHLPIGILLLAVLMEAMSRRPRFGALVPAVSLTWLAGAISALVTVALGYMHATEPGFTGPGVSLHRWAGTALAFAAIAIWAWRLEAPATFSKIWPIPLVVVLILMTATGHLGGNLTHGSTYLTEFAPGPLRSLAAGEAAPEAAPRPPITDIAKADIYLDVIAPAFRDRCASCHNDDKKRGGLSLVRYDEMMKGGETGPVIVPKDPGKSDLYHRITVARNHVDFMPKNNKTPLDPAQVQAIRWWISIGAPASGEIGKLTPPADVRESLVKAGGL